MDSEQIGAPGRMNIERQQHLGRLRTFVGDIEASAYFHETLERMEEGALQRRCYWLRSMAMF
jgi:hypothetical protein